MGTIKDKNDRDLVDAERRRQWHPIPVLLPGKSHGWRSLVGCSPWGCKESDRTERLHFHSSLSCIGEGNGNPLQCSYLENPRDGGAWWAAIYGVAQSQTRLKRLSSSRDYHTKWNKSEKDKYHVISLICGNSYITQWTYLQNKSRLIDMENRLMVARRRVLEDGWSGRLSLAIYVSYYLWNG